MLHVSCAADEADVARAVCAVRNVGSLGEADAKARVSFPLVAVSRADRDSAHLLVDRALPRIYPQVDPREYSVTFSDKHVVIELEFAPTGCMRSVEGIAYLLVDGAVEAVDPQVLKNGRKKYFAQFKDSIRTARSAILDFTKRACSRRDAKVLASGAGVTATGIVAAVCEHFAYVALPRSSDIAEPWTFVAKVPKLGLCAALKTSSKSSWCQERGSYAVRHAKGIRYVADASRSIRVEIIAHRVRLQQREGGCGEWVPDALELDDIGVLGVEPLGQPDDLNSVEWSTVDSTVALVGEVLSEPLSDDPLLQELVEKLRCLSEEPFRQPPAVGRALRAARDSLCALASAKAGQTLPWDEGRTVEFKFKVNVWTADSPGTHQTSTERLRQIMAAMANTNGGVIFVGVADDGVVHGADPIAKDVRVSQFAPSMAPDAIKITELPVAAATAAAAMQGEWWKVPAAASRAPADASAKQVLTCIRVMKGTAPYHLTGPTVDTAPMARGAASTIALSLTTMVDRLAADIRARLALKRPAA